MGRHETSRADGGGGRRSPVPSGAARQASGGGRVRGRVVRPGRPGRPGAAAPPSASEEGLRDSAQRERDSRSGQSARAGARDNGDGAIREGRNRF